MREQSIAKDYKKEEGRFFFQCFFGGQKKSQCPQITKRQIQPYITNHFTQKSYPEMKKAAM